MLLEVRFEQLVNFLLMLSVVPVGVSVRKIVEVVLAS